MGTLFCLNVGCADTTVIKTDKNDYFMIDCYDYLVFKAYLPADKHIKALFITHQHYDHFKGMEDLIENRYTIDYLIYSPYDRRYGDNSVEYDEWQDFNTFSNHFAKKGTKVYKPYRQDELKEPWWQPSGLKIWMYGPEKGIAKSDTRELHDACLVFGIETKTRTCLFTGDATDINLNYIAHHTKNMCNDILHASHHGSINGADLDFIKKCAAKYTVISTKPGVHDSIPHSTALRRYNDNTSVEVYRTDKNGTLKFNF